MVGLIEPKLIFNGQPYGIVLRNSEFLVQRLSQLSAEWHDLKPGEIRFSEFPGFRDPQPVAVLLGEVALDRARIEESILGVKADILALQPIKDKLFLRLQFTSPKDKPILLAIDANPAVGVTKQLSFAVTLTTESNTDSFGDIVIADVVQASADSVKGAYDAISNQCIDYLQIIDTDIAEMIMDDLKARIPN